MPFAGFFSNNPLVAWGLALLVVLGIIRGKEEIDEARGARRKQRDMEARARKVQVEIRKSQDAKDIQVARARESAPRGVPHSDELPDNLRSIIIGN